MDPYAHPAYDHGLDSKIVVMGNSGVGKTSLLYRYTQNRFDPKNTTSTSGAFFVTKKVHVHGLKVRLQLWDTAGQERFRSMVRISSSPGPTSFSHRHLPGTHVLSRYQSAIRRRPGRSPRFSGANAALLLYDITNSSTFEDVRGWLQGLHPTNIQRLQYLLSCRTKEELFSRTHHLHRWC
jgi:GTPase SAR1 family protein